MIAFCSKKTCLVNMNLLSHKQNIYNLTVESICALIHNNWETKYMGLTPSKTPWLKLTVESRDSTLVCSVCHFSTLCDGLYCYLRQCFLKYNLSSELQQQSEYYLATCCMTRKKSWLILRATALMVENDFTFFHTGNIL